MKTIQAQLTLTLDEATTKTLVEILTPAIKQALGVTLSDEDQRKEARRQQSLYALADGKKLPEDQGLLITAREVAKLFQVSERTVWRLCETGQIPPPIRFGRVIR